MLEIYSIYINFYEGILKWNLLRSCLKEKGAYLFRKEENKRDLRELFLAKCEITSKMRKHVRTIMEKRHTQVESSL